jgi:hypothetical protein
VLRVAVSAYLMFVTAAGPWLCCCTTARLATLFRPSAADTHHTTPAHPCCCRDADGPDRDAAPSRSERPREPQDRDGHKCPCRQNGSRDTAGLPPSADRDGQALARQTLQGAPDFVAPHVCGTSPLCPGNHLAPPDLPAFPFLTAQEILRAHHNLLC